MDMKKVSLNLVLKKKRFLDTLESIPGTEGKVSEYGDAERLNTSRGDVTETVPATIYREATSPTNRRLFGDAREPDDATIWLAERLAGEPQLIAPLIAEWVGTLDHPTGRSLDMLMQARWTLDVEAYVGEDDQLWWQLPQETVQ